MTATATKSELTAERERLAARLAEVDAQLARPVLPEGWVDASERKPETEFSVRVLLKGWTDADADSGQAYERVAQWIAVLERWVYPPANTTECQNVDGRVVAWKPLSLDWLAPAEAVVKESLTVEATTAELLEWLDSLVDHGPATKKGEFVRARILAFDHSVDLRGVWCLKPDECKDGRWRLAYLVSRNERRIGMAVWAGGRWNDERGALSAYTAVERLADPAAFMPKGGGE